MTKDTASKEEFNPVAIVVFFSYNQSNKADVLEQNRSRKSQIERKIEKIDHEQKSIAENIDKLRKDLSTQKVRLTRYSQIS